MIIQRPASWLRKGDVANVGPLEGWLPVLANHEAMDGWRRIIFAFAGGVISDDYPPTHQFDVSSMKEEES